MTVVSKWSRRRKVAAAVAVFAAVMAAAFYAKVPKHVSIRRGHILSYYLNII